MKAEKHNRQYPNERFPTKSLNGSYVINDNREHKIKSTIITNSTVPSQMVTQMGKRQNRRAKWLIELLDIQANRKSYESKRKEEFMNINSIEWMQHIDLKDISKGRQAYDQEHDGLKEGNSFIENMAEARAYIETALKVESLDFNMYDQLHRISLKGGESKTYDKLHPSSDGDYGYRAGAGGMIDEEILARVMKGCDQTTSQSLLNGMYATQQMGPLYPPGGNVILDNVYKMSKEERLEYIRSKKADLQEGVFITFPFQTEDKMKEQINSFFELYHKRIKNAYKPKNKQKTESLIIEAIATLHQQLERLHPYADGNGRTNLALLNALLKHYNLSPTILDDPSSSHLVSSKTWIENVKKGQRRWNIVEAVNKVEGDKDENIKNALIKFDILERTNAKFAYS